MKNIKNLFVSLSISASLFQSLPSLATFRPSTTKVNFSRIFIDGIQYNMSNRAVLQKLGKPQSSKDVQLCYGKVKRLNYPGMSVDIQQNNEGKFVSGIEVTRQNLGIDGVVKVGDLIAKAKKAYSPNFFQSINHKNQWYARSHPSEIGLGFKANQAGAIVKITIAVDC